MEDSSAIERSHRFVLSVQLAGLVNSLRSVVQADRQPSEESIELVRKLRRDLQTVVTGPATDDLPEISSKSNAADLLIAAEVYSSTLVALVDREEQKTIRQTIADWFALLATAKQSVG